MDKESSGICESRVVGRKPPVEIPAPATEDTGAQASPAGSQQKAPSRGFLGAARQNFTADDLKNPVVAPIIARFLLDDCERLEQDKSEIRAELVGLRERCDRHASINADQRVQISKLESKTKTLATNEILYFICSVPGAAGFPVALGIEGVKGASEYGTVGMVICGILILGSIGLRAWAIFK